MSGEAVIAALIGAVFGGGGKWLLGLLGPERDAQIARYYREVIDGLQKENRGQRQRIGQLEGRIIDLEAAVAKITEGELPPEYS